MRRTRVPGQGSWEPTCKPSGDAERRLAIIAPGERHAGRHGATSGDWVELIWEQDAAGSKASPAGGRSLLDSHRIWERMPLDS
jgi:hypothetical protein